MKAPLSWLRDVVALPPSLSASEIADAFVRAGLNVEGLDAAGADIAGPVVVARVLGFVEEPQKNGKTIRWCHVDAGAQHAPDVAPQALAGETVEPLPGGYWPRGIVCGALNFAVGDLVVASLPGSTLAGGFGIASRKTYGHVSDGMICAEDELGVGHDHAGIIVLPATDGDGRALAPGDPVADLYPRDEVFDIDVTPDMGYCLSIRGLARELGQSFDATFADPVSLDTPAATADGYPIVLDDPACGLFVAIRVDGIDPAAPTPSWLASKLAASGMRSISLPVDVSNYAMLLTGQPTHAYDADKLAGPIVVRKAEPGQTLVTLDGITRRLDPDDLLITDDSGPIGLAGVMGGESTEIGPDTTSVLIEAANFDPDTISRSLRRHSLPSEASKRFHRGVDPNAAYSTARLVAKLMVELAGGTLVAQETVVGGVRSMPAQLLDAGLPGRILGVDVSDERVVEILRASGVEVTPADSGDVPPSLIASVHGIRPPEEWVGREQVLVPPTWRPDLVDPYDYVEEVGRKVGFDAIGSIVPTAPAGRGLTRAQRARRAINAALAGAGLVELLTLPFLASDELDALGVPADDERRRLVRLANPLAETAPYLRSTLLPGLLAAVGRNTSRGADDLGLFETGSVFYGTAGVAPIPSVRTRPSDEELAAIDEALPEQPRHLGIVLTGAWRPAGWQGPAEPAGWQQAFALADVAAAAVGATIVRTAAALAPWHPGRCAALLVDEQTIGYAGELHPDAIKALGLPARTCAVELDLDALIRLAPDGGTISPLSTRPVAKEDVALIVDESVPVADLEAALREGAGELLESVALFDIYTGVPVPEGKKSCAFALRFRAPDRTLKDADAAAARDAAVAVAAERHGAVLRA